MIKLPLTFMLPVKIDSLDRERNFKIVINHLLSNYDCPIQLVEADEYMKVSNLIPKDDRIIYSFEKIRKNDPFHKTKYLNKMIFESKTEFVASYDIDVIFNPESIRECVIQLTKENFDVVYPFGYDKQDQIMCILNKNINTEEILSKNIHINPSNMVKSNYFIYNINTTECGHCHICRKKTYLEIFMENENFISWGPEDKELYNRFLVLGYKIKHLTGNKVFHLEHSRGSDSGYLNPHIIQNNLLWEKIKKMNKQEILSYYSNQDYFKKYK